MAEQGLTPLNPENQRILKRVEEILGRELEQVPAIRWNTRGYLADETGTLVGFGLFALKIKPEQLTKLSGLLPNLTQLDLSRNQLTDISVLKELPNLTQLKLWGNQLTDIEVLKELTNLTQLDLSDNQLTNIGILKALPNLTQLDLSSNQLTDLSVLKELTNLTQLDLRSNQLTDIEVLKELTNLTQLDLRSNQLTNIGILKELTNLTQLDLRSNQLTNIGILKALPNLTQLDLSDNQLTDLSVLKELTNLTQLYLSSNQLTDIGILKELTNLTQLDLSDNQLTDLSVLKELTNLTQLKLWRNQLTNIGILKELTNLTQLDLRQNQLTVISVPKELTNLTRLDLYQNQLTDVSVLKELTNLTWLDLSNNQLTDILVLKELTNLTRLDLSNNQLTDILILKELTNLTWLNLSGNQLTDLSILKKLINLTWLDLSGNQLTDISVLKELTDLTRLDLRNNQLKHIQPEFFCKDWEIRWEVGHFPDGLNLYGNPLGSPPVEIVKQGREAVNEYFRSLADGEVSVNELKVIFVGEGSAGKTSLVRRIFGEGFDKNESKTKGIDIRAKQYRIAGRNIMAHFWDFGGQEIMHATHQFFLTDNSVYVLLLDGRKEEDADHWLKHITSFGGNSPVMVVMNKIDDHHHEIERNTLKENFPSIQGFYQISCKKENDKGRDEFINDPRTLISKQIQIQRLWGKSWLKVKNRLESMKKNREPFINEGGYNEICSKCKVPESQRPVLLDRLNALGVILHFNDLDLTDMHILEPHWVTEAVYRIINDKKLSDNKGILDFKQLPTILKTRNNDDYTYPADKRRYIIDLMCKFELCYKLDDQHALIPDLLSKDKPIFSLDNKPNLKFFFTYDYLPSSIMPRFIVRLNQDIHSDLKWRTGVVLKDADYDAVGLVWSNKKEKLILVDIYGKDAREYFAIIRKTLKDIHRSFEKLPVDEYITCNCIECINVETPYVHNMNTVRNRLNKGKTSIQCGGKACNDVDINMLLGDLLKVTQNKTADGDTIFQYYIAGDYINNQGDIMKNDGFTFHGGNQTFADKIDSLVNNDHCTISDENLRKIKKEINALNKDMQVELMGYFAKMNAAKTDADKQTIGDTIKRFCTNHALPVLHSITGSALFQFAYYMSGNM